MTETPLPATALDIIFVEGAPASHLYALRYGSDTLVQLTTNPNSSHQKRQRYEPKHGSYTDADPTELGGARFP
jgi:hypothetical protein